MIRFLRIAAGIMLVVFGLFALVTPLTPGAWLGLIGLELLGMGFLIPRGIRGLWRRGRRDVQAQDDTKILAAKS